MNSTIKEGDLVTLHHYGSNKNHSRIGALLLVSNLEVSGRYNIGAKYVTDDTYDVFHPTELRKIAPKPKRNTL